MRLRELKKLIYDGSQIPWSRDDDNSGQKDTNPTCDSKPCALSTNCIVTIKY